MNSAEPYHLSITRKVNDVLDFTRDIIPPGAKRTMAIEIRVDVLDIIIKKLQAERDMLDVRRD